MGAETQEDFFLKSARKGAKNVQYGKILNGTSTLSYTIFQEDHFGCLGRV